MFGSIAASSAVGVHLCPFLSTSHVMDAVTRLEATQSSAPPDVEAGSSAGQEQRRSIAASQSSGIGVRAGTVSELLAQGPPPPCAACTLATSSRGSSTPRRIDGLFFQRGWVAFCGTHKALAESDKAPLAAPPTTSRAQPLVTSISARWKKQQLMKRQQIRKTQQKRNRPKHHM